MFERFTDSARRVVVLAQEEARLLNHNYIGTEHLLLGLIHEEEGVAAIALARLEVSLEVVRAEVEDIIGQGGSAPSGHIPFTPRAKKVLELSLREALQLGHNYIGTEHILLGLLREGDGVAAQLLANRFDLGVSRVREAVISILAGSPWPERSEGSGPGGEPFDDRPFVDVPFEESGFADLPSRRRRRAARIRRTKVAVAGIDHEVEAEQESGAEAEAEQEAQRESEQEPGADGDRWRDGRGLWQALVDDLGSQRLAQLDAPVIPGTDLRAGAAAELVDVEVLVAMIDPAWIGRSGDDPVGHRDALDPLRLRIEAAIDAGVTVIPVLVDGATLPAPDELPEPLRDLGYLVPASISAETWDDDVAVVIAAVRSRLR